MAAAAGASGTAISINEGFYDIKHRSLLALGTGWAYTDAALAGHSRSRAAAPTHPFPSKLPALVAREW